MKKHLLTLTLLALSVVVFNGCKDDEDTTPPVITLIGDNPYTQTLNSTYNDPGATATDDEDGDLSLLIAIDESEVNKDKVGSYEVHYEVSDAAGNVSDVHRTVNVVNSLTSSAWSGNYSCVITDNTGGTYSYNESLAISTTLNNGMEWSKFGDYSGGSAKLNIKINNNNQVDVPSQSFNTNTSSSNPAPVLRTFSGSGVYTGSGAAGSTITLSISETVNSNTASFTYVYTKL